MAIGRLLVSFGANEAWDITGEAELVCEQYDELVAVLQAVDGVHDRFFELVGFRNLADRKPERFVIRVDDIKGVDFQEM